MKGKQTNIRRLWTIYTLLDGEEKTQTQIVKQLNKIGTKLKNTIEANELQKTTKAIESPIIKDLTEKNIIKGELKDLKGSNLKANFCTIPNNLKTFINILNEIENSYVNEDQKKIFISHLINSKIGQKHINQELITILLKKHQISQVEFHENEIEFITSILLNSPQALKYTIKSIKNKEKEWGLSEAKDYYLYKIQTLLNLDLLDQYLQPAYENESKKIQFNTTISFKETTIANKPLSTEITTENMNFTFLHKINTSKDTKPLQTDF